MAVSVVSASQVANWFTTTSPQTVGSLSWSTGDVIIVVGTGESATLAVLATPTNASLTFSLRASVTTGGSTEAPAYIWSAVAGSAQSGQTISMANSGGGMFGLAVWVLSGASGSFANASANQTESGFTFTPISGSGVVYGYGDWAATSGKTIATATGTPTERYDTTNGTNYGVYGGDWMDVAASSATFGITSYAGMTVAHAVVEVLASAAGEAPPAIGSPSRHGPGHRRGPLGRMDLLRAYHHRRYSTDIITAVGEAHSGDALDTDRTSGLTTGAKGGVGTTSGGTRVSGLTTGIKNATGLSSGPQRSTGTSAATKQATGAIQGQQHSSGATVGVKGSVGATAGQQRSSGLAVKGTPPAAAAVGQPRVSGATSGIKNATATTAIGQIRSSGATSGVHRAIGGAVGQLRSVGAVVAAKATSGATSGRQRTSGLVDTFVGITGGTLTVADRAVVTLQPAGRATATLGTADRAAANFGTGDRATASLAPSDRSTATLTEADR